MHRRISWVILTSAAAGCMALSAGPASASHVGCGDTITADLTLHNDLINCPGDGIVIGADNVTLDLNHHTIDGPGFQPPSIRNFGVRFDGAHRGVTVRNGTIREFYAGVGLPSGNRVIQLSGNNGNYGVLSAGHNRIAFNRISGRTAAIVLAGGADHVVANALSGGIISVASDENRIERNRGASVSAEFLDPEVETSRNHVANNSLRDIRITNASGWSIENNLVRGGGIGLSGPSNLVRRNTILNSAGNGISVNSGAPSVGEVNSRDNVILGNHVARSAGEGIFIEGSNGCPTPGSCLPGAFDTLVRHNRTRRNGDDGIHADSPTTTLAKNFANRNTDLGIEAATGVIDGGGNHAHGNGNPLQCTNIVCG